jgi:hypothetical protein
MISQIFVALNSDEKIVSHIGRRTQKKNELVHFFLRRPTPYVQSRFAGLNSHCAGMLNNHYCSWILV